jgi:DNA-binding MarR family transcriptional regulator
MATSTLSDEHLRALRFLARHPGGCTEATLLKQGFTTGQLGHLVYAGFAKLRRGGGYAKVFRMKITAAGREAIAE